jgi:hypothetical protein
MQGNILLWLFDTKDRKGSGTFGVYIRKVVLQNTNMMVLHF